MLILKRRQPPRRSPVTERQDWGPPIEIRCAEHWRFQWHEETLKRHDLPRGAIAVAGVLMHTFNPALGYAKIGYGELARRGGCSRSTAASAIRRLKREGLVRVRNPGIRLANRSLEIHRYELTYLSRGVGCTDAPIEVVR